jgi:hypothetical protein
MMQCSFSTKVPNCTQFAVKPFISYTYFLYNFFFYIKNKKLTLWNAKVLANLPYKFAILEASHKGAKNPNTLLKARVKIAIFFQINRAIFFVQCLNVFVSFQ